MNLNDITIVVLVKDTPLYLYRWLIWIQQKTLDVKIIIADGSSNQDSFAVFKVFENKLLNLTYQYREKDKSREIYYSKINYALNSVKTPYVAVCAPDDLISLEGFEHAIHELNNSPSSVCARGRIHDFECKPNPSDIWAESIYWKWHKAGPALSTYDNRARIYSHLSEYCLTYHDVTRTEISKSIFQLQYDLKILDPNLNELFLSSLLAIKGPIIRLQSPYLFRAARPNSISAKLSKKIDTYDEMFQKDWFNQYSNMLDTLSQILYEQDRTYSQDENRNYIHRCFRNFYAPLLIKTLCKNTNRERFKLNFNESVHPYIALETAPDQEHEKQSQEVLVFLQNLKGKSHEISHKLNLYPADKF